MSLRVLGGTYKNHPLKSPRGSSTRPTPSLVRKAVFDICRPGLAQASFLDLFAGSGAMGIEALSQGAARSVFVDKNLLAARCIRENLKALDLSLKAEVICADAKIALKALTARGLSFDIIYIDPPYNLSLLAPLLEQIDASRLVNSGGLVFTEERAQNEAPPPPLTHLRLKNTRRLSDALLRQYEPI